MIPADILTALFVALFMVLAYRAGVVAGKAVVRRLAVETEPLDARVIRYTDGLGGTGTITRARTEDMKRDYGF